MVKKLMKCISLITLINGLLFTVISGQYSTYGACQSYARRYNAANQLYCATRIRQLASDPNKFWFGTVYDSNCPVKFPDTRLSPCSDPPKEGFTHAQFRTLGSRLFSDTNFNSASDLQGIIYPIDVTYRSDAGIVRGCNTSLLSNVNRYIEIEPDMYPVAAWHLRNPPIISSPGCTNVNLCTIVMLDVGHMFLHGAWANFPREQTLTNYLRPGHASLTSNPYVFIALRQADDNITLDLSPYSADEWAFELRPFMTAYNLQGPIALTWVNVIGEVDSAQRLTDSGIQQNCPEFLILCLFQDRFRFTYDLGLVPPVALSYWMMVKFNTPQPRLQTCCNTVANEAWLDPIRNGALFPVDIQSPPQVTIQARVRQPTEEDLAGKFTLILTSRDETPGFLYNSPTSAPVYLHWLIYNADGTDLTGGTEALAYQPPATVNGVCSTNRFYFLLYQQTGDLENIDSLLTTNCTPTISDKRCRFNLVSLATAQNLTLVGVSRFTVACTAYNTGQYVYSGYKNRDEGSRSNKEWQLDPLIKYIADQD